DGIDQDCDGVDDCYEDLDGDAFGSSTVIAGVDLSCAGSGEAATADDCDDADASVYPAAAEVPVDGIDQDCDGGDDCYVDADLDGFGTSETLAGADLTCGNPGESRTTDDCDDTSAVTHPGAAPLDDPTACMTDADDDDYGDESATGDVTPGTDCDDAEATTHPGASETWYDGVDSDCAGDDDNDADADGVGVDEDCDDGDPTVFPGAEDTWYDGVDSDCAGDDDNDADADGFGVDEDCDDGDASVYPGADDIPGDGIDQDCDSEDAEEDSGDIDGDGDANAGDDVDGDGDKGSVGCASLPVTDMALTPLLLGLATLAARRRRED
ncbi:MAG: MopE-related protein, partial [Myxococcota bacterium]|nr:MopE-related protein [Myxococcota bacterium]